ncbi:SPASM domain-containing protein, partial [bacterium]|nr:SPASM domain-containing protein [candidate division CSSED10-310 bacterium]
KPSPAVLFPCFEPWYIMVIYADGQILPCRSYKGITQYAGELGLAAAWHGEVFQRMRQELAMGRLLEFCGNCNAGQIIEDRRVREQIARFQRGSIGSP